MVPPGTLLRVSGRVGEGTGVGRNGGDGGDGESFADFVTRDAEDLVRTALMRAYRHRARITRLRSALVATALSPVGGHGTRQREQTR